MTKMAEKMFPTRNDLSESTRLEVVALLNASLADAIDLTLQTKQAHWNVKGPQFLQLHELFDKTYEAATDWVDLLAERAVQLGGVAEGTLRAVGKRTRLSEYPVDLAEGRAHLEKLSDSVAAFARSVREAIRTADRAGDDGTADLFTEISRGADERLWFLESHLQAER
jgi:starvation-inducible DNA-binding protein